MDMLHILVWLLVQAFTRLSHYCTVYLEYLSSTYPPHFWVMGINFISKYILSIYFWQRQWQCVSRGGAERDRNTESEAGSRLWAVSTEPNAGLKLVNYDIMTRAKVGRLSNWATQASLNIHFKNIVIITIAQRVLFIWLSHIFYLFIALPSFLPSFRTVPLWPVQLLLPEELPFALCISFSLAYVERSSLHSPLKDTGSGTARGGWKSYCSGPSLRSCSSCFCWDFSSQSLDEVIGVSPPPHTPIWVLLWLFSAALGCSAV